MERYSLDEYFLAIAGAVAKRSTCLRRNVGAIIVKDKQIISTGYNGPPSGIPHCEKCSRYDSDSGKDSDKCFAVHAEQNAIINAAKHGICVDGGTMYTLLYPCFSCAKSILNAGIKEVVYFNNYADLRAAFLFNYGVKIRKYTRDPNSTVDIFSSCFCERKTMA